LRRYGVIEGELGNFAAPGLIFFKGGLTAGEQDGSK
jgi:hypothetical protein